MNRSIPFVLSLALIGPVASAEDTAKDQAASQDAAAAQQDQAGASQDAAAAQDPSAAGQDQAQTAAGRQGQQQDPTQLFVKHEYSHNLYEIQLGQWIQKNAQDDQIKQLAQMLVKDHTQANQQLKQVAQSAGVQLEERLDPVHQAKLQKFQQLPQSEVARKFANDQVAGHMMGVLEFTYQSKNAKDPQVKQYATKALPKMQQHLDHVTQIATQLAGGSAGGEAQPASARQPGQRGQQQQESQDAGSSDQQSGQDAAGQSGQDAAGQSGQSQDSQSK
jgi:putative membrane protein